MRALDAVDPRQIGRFAVAARLGAGAMGAVYLAHSAGGRPVAVKLVHPGLADDPDFRERFRREIAAARRIGGFWTPVVVDADADATAPWLATEFVPGPTLQEAVRTAGPLPEPTLRRLAAGLAEALAAIHAVGLVHRDVKPSNVLLAADGPRLIDFGIARALDHSGLTASGMVFGSPGYTSPEQVAGVPAGPASDIYSLGATLVFAATGTGPFGTGSRTELLRRAALGRADAGSTPPAIRPLVEACLHPDPDRRPAPAQLLDGLRHAGGIPEQTGDWLPRPVQTMVTVRAARLADERPPTLLYTTPAGVSAGPGEGGDRAGAAGAGSAAGGAASRKPAASWEPGATVGSDSGAARGSVPAPRIGSASGAPASPGPVGSASGDPAGWASAAPTVSMPLVRTDSETAVAVGSASPALGAAERHAAARAAAPGPEGSVADSGPDSGPVGSEPDVAVDPASRQPVASASPGPVGSASPGSASTAPHGPGDSASHGLVGSASHGSAGSAPHGLVGSASHGPAGSAPHGPAVPAPTAPTPGWAPGPASPPAAGGAWFAVNRRWAALRVGLCLLGLAWATGLPESEPAERLVAFLVVVFCLVVLARTVFQLFRLPTRLAVDAAGLGLVDQGREVRVAWRDITRVAVVGLPRDPWLVIWVADARCLGGARFRQHRGGHRVYRIGAWRGRRGREAEVRELRAALNWHTGRPLG